MIASTSPVRHGQQLVNTRGPAHDPSQHSTARKHSGMPHARVGGDSGGGACGVSGVDGAGVGAV